MIEHIVLFRFKSDIEDAAKQRLIEELRGLEGRVPSIRSISSGLNFSTRGDGYEAGLVIRFDDQAGLDSYQIHPDHVRVVQDCVKPVVEKVLAVDYHC